MVCSISNDVGWDPSRRRRLLLLPLEHVHDVGHHLALQEAVGHPGGGGVEAVAAAHAAPHVADLIEFHC